MNGFIACEGMQIFHGGDNFHTQSRSYNLRELNVTRLIAISACAKKKEKKINEPLVVLVCVSIVYIIYTNRQERSSNKNAAII